MKKMARSGKVYFDFNSHTDFEIFKEFMRERYPKDWCIVVNTAVVDYDYMYQMYGKKYDDMVEEFFKNTPEMLQTVQENGKDDYWVFSFRKEKDARKMWDLLPIHEFYATLWECGNPKEESHW